MKRVVILGGYGVFGSLIAKELVSKRIQVTIAGRDEKKARRLVQTLGNEARAVAIDARDVQACTALFREHAVAMHCAGPFAANETSVLDACLAAGCHYVDIADDRAYADRVRSYDRRFRDAGLAAIYGASSLPGISGALAAKLARESPATPERIRVTLFIGNRNPKGEAAVRSAFRTLGKSIAAPQGTLTGFGGPETVALPPPWNDRRVYDFEGPEYDLFPAEFGARSVSVKLGFESKLVTRLFAFLARRPKGFREALFPALLGMGNAFSRLGTSGGSVMVEFFDGSGKTRRSVASVPEGGQTLAIRPAVACVEELLSAPLPMKSGALTSYSFLGDRSPV